VRLSGLAQSVAPGGGGRLFTSCSNAKRVKFTLN
jgi:hypothetical protein